MEYKCTECSATLSVDLRNVGSYSLELECASCSTVLSLSHPPTNIGANLERGSVETLRAMVKMALADGLLSEEETALLASKATELGINQSVLSGFVSELQVMSDSSPAYSENIASYRSENGFYDWAAFAAKVGSLSTDDPNLRRYRDDFMTMVSSNAEKFKELARTWVQIYEKSADETDWDEILENKRRCLDGAAALRSLRDDLSSKSKVEFVAYVKALSAVETAEEW